MNSYFISLSHFSNKKFPFHNVAQKNKLFFVYLQIVKKEKYFVSMPLLFTLSTADALVLKMCSTIFLSFCIVFFKLYIFSNIRNPVDQFKSLRKSCMLLWFVVYCFYGWIYRMTSKWNRCLCFIRSNAFVF